MGLELLIPCGDFLISVESAWNQRDPKRSDGVVEYWCVQHSNTPLLDRSGSLGHFSSFADIVERFPQFVSFFRVHHLCVGIYATQPINKIVVLSAIGLYVPLLSRPLQNAA